MNYFIYFTSINCVRIIYAKICRLTNSSGILTHAPRILLAVQLSSSFQEAFGFSDRWLTGYVIGCKRFAYPFLLAYFLFQHPQFPTSNSGRPFSRNLAQKTKKNNCAITYVIIRSSFFWRKREDLGTKLVYTLAYHSSRTISAQEIAQLL